jgi:hypothetical protein
LHTKKGYTLVTTGTILDPSIQYHKIFVVDRKAPD